MATFGLPDKVLLSEEVQSFLPSDYDGVSTEPVLVQVFERFTENHTVSDKLRGIVAMSQSLPQFFAGLAETFPETEADGNDFWSLEANSQQDILFWFRMFQTYGNIFENGNYLSIKGSLESQREAMEDDSIYLDESVLERSFAFTKFLREEGSYTSVSDTYFFLSYVDDEEALKLLASGISLEEYKNYIEVECYTYSEIYEGQMAELPAEWRDFLFEQLVQN